MRTLTTNDVDVISGGLEISFGFDSWFSDGGGGGCNLFESFGLFLNNYSQPEDFQTFVALNADLLCDTGLSVDDLLTAA